MQLTRLLGVIVIFAAAARPANADILVWRDASGISHYTNDMANVPAEYRGAAITVAKDFARAEPPPDPAPAPAAAAEPVSAREAYEAAYVAGLRAAEQAQLAAPAAGNTNTTSVTQSFAVQPQAGQVIERYVPVQVIVDRVRPRPPHDDDRDAARDRLPPAQRAPFIQGPAGPPPVSER